MTVWFDEEFVRTHWRPEANGKRGAPFLYSDVAIQVLLMLKGVFHLPYRALEGFARSLMRMMELSLPIPDHTQLLRRARTLQVVIPRQARPGPIHVVVDSTGMKICGEGEWKVRQHGVGKRRTWRKVHFAADADVKEVIGVEVTTTEWMDGEVYEAGMARGADVVVPPRANAVPWAADHPRTRALADIAAQGLSDWKESSGYHRRSLAENAIYRFKQIFGDRLASRLFETQGTEVHARVAAMNTMTALGMPVSIRVGTAAA